MANLNHYIDADVDESDKFLTVGELMDILKDVNSETKVFIRNLDEWGNKIVIKDGFGYSEASDGLIENVMKGNIDQVTGEEEYIIIQGCVAKYGFVTLDREPYQRVIYHHTWWDKHLRKITPIETMKQLKDRFLKVKHECRNCESYNMDGTCNISKLKVQSFDSCELWTCQE